PRRHGGEAVRAGRHGLVCHGRAYPSAEPQAALFTGLCRPRGWAACACPCGCTAGAASGGTESAPHGADGQRRCSGDGVMNACVWGIGTSKFGRQPEKSSVELVWEAVI